MLFMAVFSISLLRSKKAKSYLALDFGASNIKFLCLGTQYNRSKLNYLGLAKTPVGAFSNGVLSNPGLLAKFLEDLVKEKGILEKDVIFSIPTTNVFIKKIIVHSPSVKELEEKIPFEAANYIPQNAKDVYLDFQVLRKQGKNSFEVLLAAAKKDVVANYLEAITEAGLQPLIADVDTFSLENAFEHSCADFKDGTIAILNLGESYSNITILQDGQLLTNGDIAKGARQYRAALAAEFSLENKDIDSIFSAEASLDEKFLTCINNVTASFSDELCQQISYLWAAAGTDKKILGLFVSGGIAKVPGLLDALQEKTGINCKLLDVFNGVDTSGVANFNQQDQHLYAVCFGLALRKLGDKRNIVL